MKTNNLFIVEGSPLSSIRLVNYLEERMGRTLTLFSNAEKALRHINKNTKLVILDSSLEEKKANVLQNKIKKINQETEVIRLSVPGSNNDAVSGQSLFFKGLRDYSNKGNATLRELNDWFSKIINYPIEILVGKLGINKLFAILLTHFAFIGAVYFIFILIMISLGRVAFMIPKL
jgi:DNA-binding NtrC family response regulator